LNNRVTHALIEKILKKSGLTDSIETIDFVASGLRNLVYRVAFRNTHPNVCVRIKKPQPVDYAEQFGAEQFAFQLLRGINAPRLYAACTERNEFGFPFAVFDFIEGNTLETSLRHPIPPDDAKCLLEKLAKSLATLHQVSGPGFGHLTMTSHTADRPGLYLENLLQPEGARLIPLDPTFADVYRKITKRCGAIVNSLPATLTCPVLVHGDMHGRNAIITEERKIFFIDWDASGFGIAASDLAQICIFDLKHKPALAAFFLETYADAAGITSECRTLRMLVDIFQFYWHCRIGLFQTAFPQAQGQFWGSAEEHLDDARRYAENVPLDAE
jgi:aminoglycoside phosphotransferase (APT) family kinase protein